MATPVFLIFAIAGIALLSVLAMGVWRYRWWSGTRVTTCPATQRPAAVDVDAMHAALTTVVGHRVLRLQQCSNWPQRRNCGQECLAQIELTPGDCLVQSIVSQWYEGKSCAFCGKPFGRVRLWRDKPALLARDGKTMQWSDVPANLLPDVLATQKPVCWTCYITVEFEHMRPELTNQVPPPGASVDSQRMGFGKES